MSGYREPISNARTRSVRSAPPTTLKCQQAERSGLSPQQAKEQVTRLWHQADSGTAFAAALRNEGWVLAKGDKRDFVLVDSFGETHSLARRIEGAKAAEVRERMAELDAAKLPSVAEARELQRGTLADRANENRKEKVHAAVPIILKLPMPIEHDSAKPLQVATARPNPSSFLMQPPKPLFLRDQQSLSRH